MTIVKTLKALYERLGGTPSDVANATRAVDVLNAIAALYGGASNATHIAKAIANIVAVASGLIKPSGTKSITANGSDIDVKEYAAVNVAVPQPSGTINITENGSDIDVAQYATANVNVISTNNDLALATVGQIRNAIVDFSEIDTTYIRDGAFEDCESLNSVQFTGGSVLVKIGSHAFLNTWVTSLDFSGYRIMNVWGDAFHTTHLTTIYFGQVDEFSQNAFFGCTALTDIYYTGTQAEWEAITGLSGAGIPAGCTVHYEYTPTP